MPGIFGLSLHNTDGRLHFTAMTQKMRLLPTIHIKSISESPEFCCATSHIALFAHHDVINSDVQCWFDGELYQTAHSKPDNAPVPEPAEQLRNAYLAGELASFLRAADGAFNAVIYDMSQDKVLLIADRYGMRNLYYQKSSAGLCFAAEVKAILAARLAVTELAQLSFDCFMELGYLLEDHTWFNNIKLLPPATILEFDKRQNKSRLQRYWEWSEIKQQKLSFDDAVDQAAELMLESVKRRFNPNSSQGVSLSGGLDSRFILACIHKLWPDYPGQAYTFGTEECADITISKEVIRQIPNWKHHISLFTADNWFSPRIQKVLMTDGMLDMQHMHGSEFLQLLNYKIDMNGYAGDAILGGSFLDAKSCDQRITPALARRFYGAFTEYCDLNDTIYDLPHFEPHLYMNRIRRLTQMGVVNSQFDLEIRRPFMSNNLLEFVFSIPDHYRLNNKLYGTLLSRHFPKFYRNIRWQKTGWPISEQCPAGTAAVSGIAPPDFGKLQAYINYENLIRQPDAVASLTRLLNNPNALWRQLTDVDYYREFFIPHIYANLNRCNKILRLATVEIYLQNTKN
ncbi:asparagine synthase-related protein [Rheinheimera sp. MMS21-TC3]|uniref:asparagine synthase-related protein n=1 Tax=Rheinheimera sp. MMS21-TC3 TaxID=3072790 RepID=UPI0028C44299|nr:asparagine synthase-related protein [Rheinheimera sp. MMS21-TC3]WNO61812.1 asparagine synthase-related protein [Rheinheimera sp. MMS21-TC3]